MEEEGRREHEGTGEERGREMGRGGEEWEEEERREKEGSNTAHQPRLFPYLLSYFYLL